MQDAFFIFSDSNSEEPRSLHELGECTCVFLEPWHACVGGGCQQQHFSCTASSALGRMMDMRSVEQAAYCDACSGSV